MFSKRKKVIFENILIVLSGPKDVARLLAITPAPPLVLAGLSLPSLASKKHAPAPYGPQLSWFRGHPVLSKNSSFRWFLLLLCFVLVLVTPEREVYMEYREKMKDEQNQ